MDARTVRPTRRVRRGITRLEVLAIVAAAGLVAAIAVSAVQQAREAARRAQCKSQLKQLGLALHNNYDVDKFFPPGSTSRAAYMAYLLPFIDSRCGAFHEFLDPRNGTAATTNTMSIAVFLCPANVEATNLNGETTYLGSSGRQNPSTTVAEKLRGVFRDEYFLTATGEPKTGTDPSLYTYPGWSWRGNYFNFRDNSDGTSFTIAVGESTRGGIRWCAPRFPDNPHVLGVFNTEPAPAGDSAWGAVNAAVPGAPGERALWSSHHPRGAQFVLVDGAVVFVDEHIDPDVFGALVTIRGGEAEPELPQ